MRKNKVKTKFLFVFFTFCSVLIISQINYNGDIFENDAQKSMDDPKGFINTSNRPSNSSFFIYYKTIIIDHNKVNGTSNLVNFPLLISILDSDLKNNVQANGNDIRFANETDWLDHEIEVFNQNYDATYAQLVAWVRIPSLSPTTDTVIYMYYGNFTMGSQENPSGVWNSNYKGIWHLSEEPTGTIYDSTVNNNDGATFGSMTSNDQISGQIDGSLDLDGDNDYITTNYAGVTGSNARTISFWMNTSSISDRDIISYGDFGINRFIIRIDEVDSTGNWVIRLEMKDATTLREQRWSTHVVDGNWHYVVVVVPQDIDISQTLSYIDGQLDTINETFGTGIANSGSGGTHDFQMSYELNKPEFNGTLDEVRVSNTNRSAEWITTEYDNQFNPNSFYTIGSEQLVSNNPPNADYFNYYKEITIDHTKVNGNSYFYDFPMLISILDRDLHDDVQPSGNDIAFAKDSIWLNHEIELFNRSYNETHAELIVWVQIPSLSPNSNTNITMYYGNSTMGSQENTEEVWDAHYKGIWHLKEDPAETQFLDSTSYNNNGSAVNLFSSNQTIGKIDGGLIFNDDNEACVNVSDDNSLDLDTNMTISAWVKTGDAQGDTEVIITKWDISPNSNYWLGKLNANDFAFFVDSTQNVKVNLNLINDNKWHFVVGVADSPNNLLRIYIDGIEKNTALYSGSSETGTHYLNIGRSSGITSQEWNGIIDEVRVSNIARSADWIATEFSNQEDPSNFYKIGNKSLIVKHPPDANYFKYYKIIQISHTKVNGSSTLNNFPLLISLLDSDLHENVRSNGNDIKFAMDGKWLDHEIELFNKNYDSSQAQLISWVRIPSLSPLVDSLIFMYYGNTTMGSQETPSGVWDTNYKGIWHLSEDPTGTIYDSTSNNNDGTATNLTSNDQIIGQIDGSLDFYGNDNYISMGSSINIASSSFSVSTWAKRGSSTSADIIFQQGSAGQNTGFHAGFRNSGLFTFAFWADDLDTAQSYNDTNWHYWSCTYDAPTKDRKVYRDGVNIASDIASNHFLGSDTFYLGYDGMVNEGFDGQLDESRLLNIALSSEWIATEYNNQYDPNGFYTLSKVFLVSDDIQGPDIQINSPVEFELFGQNSPVYNVSIDDYSGIDTMWYILSNGTFNTTATTFTELTGNINQTRWDELGNGTVTILFYANDTRGNLNNLEITVRKDNVHPYVDITAPAYDGEQIGGDTISISGIANGTESNIVSIYINDTRWGDGSQKPQIDPSGFISKPFRFDNNSNITPGFYWVEINITDAAGNVNSSVRKFQVITLDVSKPILIITSIFPDLTNGFTNITMTSNENLQFPPLLNITLPNSAVIYRPMRVIGPLTWCANYTVDSNGIYTVQINGTDIADNIGYTLDTFEGDITAPYMAINIPTLNDLYGKTPPNYNLTITDVNLNSFWYSLDGGLTNSTPVAVLGTINQSMWNAKGNGTITIRFYANDEAGNLNFTEIKIRKDIFSPSIEITDPTDYELFGEEPPDITIDVNEPNLDDIWYQLENVSFTTDNYTWAGLIPQSTWDQMGNGTVLIRFYVNDTVGNKNNTIAIIYKDITIPDIMISNPTPNNAFNDNSPDFTISVSGSNLNERSYTLNDGITNYTFTGLNGKINQSAWDSQGDGLVMIKFYLNNKLGLVGFDETQVIKDTITPSVTINLPQNNTYCGTAPFINVLASDSNLDTIWYRVTTLDVILVNNVNQQLESSIWGILPEDWFNIYIYANDTVGHVNNIHNLTLYKDITQPPFPALITFPEGDVNVPIVFNWEDGTDFSGISYYRLIIDDEVDPYTTPGFVFDVIIPNLGSNSSYYKLEENLEDGEYYFFLYQIDGAGHQSNSFSGSFTIGAVSRNSQEFPSWIIIIIIGAVAGLTVSLVIAKRTKKEKIKVIVIDKELEKLKKRRELLETKAKSALKAYDYGKTAELYEECGKISYKLYEEGDKIEESKYKHYKVLELEARAHLEAIPLRNACINNLLTKFFDEVGVKYYSDPQIYPENQETINGLILNDTGFLQIRFTKLEDGSSLAEELEIDPAKMDYINAMQIVYSVDMSIDAIINYCQKFQNPEMMLFIVGLEWPAYHYEETMTIPKDKDIKYPENIKIININLFSRIFSLKGQYQTMFTNVIDLKYDLESIKELYESTKIALHDTTELKNKLKQKGWFFLT